MSLQKKKVLQFQQCYNSNMMLRQKLFALLLSLAAAVCYEVSFDHRAFLIDGERTLFIGGSIHYPRSSASEWPLIIEEAKNNGLNLIETYVFWDIHEPEEGKYYFPNDGSSADFVQFLTECQKQGIYVNLRFGPYVCAEWNYGGFPAWLREKKGIEFRSTHPAFTEAMSAFVDETMNIVSRANLLAADGGPVAMLQIENEFGNMEHFYPKTGADYVQWAAGYAEELTAARNISLPWMMCQQGEGVGTAPPASVINACNGYYCDNWIEQHIKDFPNQPHLWTENWPGWYQRWGEAVPHRPAVDVAFAVARWYAKGGSFMNYYMAFGGTSFGRHVGGPLIVTSYDYDVQINEYVLRAEPKFTLLQRLHQTLAVVAPIILAHDSIPAPQAPHQAKTSSGLKEGASCEAHHYDQYAEDLGCVSFYSNYGTGGACVFTDETTGWSLEVPAWSVSIVSDSCTDNPTVLLNTRNSAADIPSNHISTHPFDDLDISQFKVFTEQVPSAVDFDDTGATVITALHPLDQLSTTLDSTDYMWLSMKVPLNNTATTTAAGVTSELRYLTGMSGGPVAYAFVDGQLQDSTIALTQAAQPSEYIVTATAAADKAAAGYALQIEDHELGAPIKMDLTLPTPDFGEKMCSVDLLVMSMGLKNYGPHLEKIKIGVVSDVTIDANPVTGYKHVVGLQGERYNLYAETLDAEASALFKDVVDVSVAASPLSWYRATFKTPADIVLAAERVASRTAAMAAAVDAIAQSAAAAAAAANAAAVSAAAAAELARAASSATNTGTSTGSDSAADINTRELFQHTGLAVDISQSQLRKGALWVNGVMLGRYWSVAVDDTNDCGTREECDWNIYTGPYSAEQCRSGCGSLSQALYKISSGLLYPSRSDLNSIVFFDEMGGNPEGVQIVQIQMTEDGETEHLR